MIPAELYSSDLVVGGVVLVHRHAPFHDLWVVPPVVNAVPSPAVPHVVAAAPAAIPGQKWACRRDATPTRDVMRRGNVLRVRAGADDEGGRLVQLEGGVADIRVVVVEGVTCVLEDVEVVGRGGMAA